MRQAVLTTDVTDETAARNFQEFLCSQSSYPYLLVNGDAGDLLPLMPTGSIDAVLTSPPYWRQRDYAHADALGQEDTLQEYIDVLLRIFTQVKRVLKPTGSFWLNLGDAYVNKSLYGLPWRVALALQDTQGWILRNSIVWNKVKGGPDNAKDKLRNMHEMIFHFVKQKDYYYDTDDVRNGPGVASVRNGAVVSATGVSGVNYRRQIQRSTVLTEEEKANALHTLEATLHKLTSGELFDFRMVIRGQQRATHSGSAKVSGRAAELEKNGFYILPYDKRGSKPGDVWDIIPEDEWRKDGHDAPFPEQLCTLPIKLTCPLDGVVLDPFAGTGTALLAAVNLRRRGIGLDISPEYLVTAHARLRDCQPVLIQESPSAYEPV